MSSLQTARFLWEKVWQRSSSANQCAAVRARVVLLLPLSPFPSRSDVLVVPPATQLDRRVAKTSRLHEKSYPPDHEQQDLLRCQECARKLRTITVEISYVREEKREKSDPWVRSLVKECAHIYLEMPRNVAVADSHTNRAITFSGSLAKVWIQREEYKDANGEYNQRDEYE